jgi:hypothetical protein
MNVVAMVLKKWLRANQPDAFSGNYASLMVY